MKPRKATLIVGTLGIALAVVLLAVLGGPLGCARGKVEEEGPARLVTEGSPEGAAQETTPEPAGLSASEEIAVAAPESSDSSAERTFTSEEDKGREEARQAVPARGPLELVTIFSKDDILAVFEPLFIETFDAVGKLVDNDLVIGLSINGDHRAYPVPVLSVHEVVNDVVGGKPVAVTW